MKKSENLIATLLAVYAIILVLCIAIYSIFKLLEVDITLATNLLLWSAAIFAPIAVLMTYTGWKAQKRTEFLAQLALDLRRKLLDNFLKLADVMHYIEAVKYKDNIDQKQLQERLENLKNIQLTILNNFDFLIKEYGYLDQQNSLTQLRIIVSSSEDYLFQRKVFIENNINVIQEFSPQKLISIYYQVNEFLTSIILYKLR